MPMHLRVLKVSNLNNNPLFHFMLNNQIFSNNILYNLIYEIIKFPFNKHTCKKSIIDLHYFLSIIGFRNLNINLVSKHRLSKQIYKTQTMKKM